MASAPIEIVRSVVGLLWPQTCAGCGADAQTAGGFCPACGGQVLGLVAGEYCPRCGSTLGEGLRAGSDGCYRCPSPMPRFERLVRVGPYAAPLRQAIHRMKYHRRAHVAVELARLLAEAVRARCPTGDLDLVLPVPMHWLRRLARGWNHSQALAEVLAERLHLPLGRELVRVRPTPPQVHLPASQRAANVRGAFEVARPRNLAGVHALLVDDVVTTGATANEAARALLSAGAARVTVAVVAKAEAPAAYSHPLQTGA